MTFLDSQELQFYYLRVCVYVYCSTHLAGSMLELIVVVLAPDCCIHPDAQGHLNLAHAGFHCNSHRQRDPLIQLATNKGEEGQAGRGCSRQQAAAECSGHSMQITK